MKTKNQAIEVASNQETPTTDRPERLLRSGPTRKLCGDMPRSTMYALIAKKEFPKPVSLTGGRAVAWRESDIIQFIKSRTEKVAG